MVPTACAINFWPGFTRETSLLDHLLRETVGAFRWVDRQKDADVVLTSVFEGKPPAYPHKTVGVLWENVRPDYSRYRYSLSGDFDSYSGRNARLPVWFSAVSWPAMPRDPIALEATADPKAMTVPRPSTGVADRPRFACFVARSSEPHRQLALEELEELGAVDLWGGIRNRWFTGSKLDLLADYRFNVCFENSAFPGYYTEKLVHAWQAGSVPLYYSDPWWVRDFNPAAALNRIDYPSVSDYVDQVRRVAASRDAMDELTSQPLLLCAPSLEEPVALLRKVFSDLVR